MRALTSQRQHVAWLFRSGLADWLLDQQDDPLLSGAALTLIGRMFATAYRPHQEGGTPEGGEGGGGASSSVPQEASALTSGGAATSSVRNVTPALLLRFLRYAPSCKTSTIFQSFSRRFESCSPIDFVSYTLSYITLLVSIFSLWLVFALHILTFPCLPRATTTHHAYHHTCCDYASIIIHLGTTAARQPSATIPGTKLGNWRRWTPRPTSRRRPGATWRWCCRTRN